MDQKHLDTLRDYLSRFENLQTAGRAGMHWYNNQDHPMLATQNIHGDLTLSGEPHDIGSVNVKTSYHESFVIEDDPEVAPGEHKTSKASTADGASQAATSCVVPS